jgi:osmoprotectant transport system substrate-binding protein
VPTMVRPRRAGEARAGRARQTPGRTPRRSSGSLVTMSRPLVVLLALLLAACSSGVGAADPDGGEVEPPVRVATASDAETRLLAHVMVDLLEREGWEVELVEFAGADDSRQALELGAVDVRLGYTGEAWLETLGRADPPGDPQESVASVHAHDLEDGIVWLRPRFEDGVDGPPANATFAFVVMGPPGADADLRTVSELATRLSEQSDARVCVDPEFGSRPDGLRAVLEAYSVRSDRPFLAASPEEAVLGVAAGDCLAGLTTATDGGAWRAGLQTLVDDLEVFPAFVPLPQVRQEVLEERPDVRQALSPLSAELTTHLLSRGNGAVAGGVGVEEAAAELSSELLRRAGHEVDEG